MLQSQPNAKARVTLTILEGAGQGQAIAVQSGESLTVGRSASLQVSILDPRMSRKHFCLEESGSLWQIRDLASLNGTLINGTPIQQEILQQGDVVMAGDAKFQVTFPDGDQGPRRPPNFSGQTVDKKISNRTTSNYDDLS